MGRYQLLTQIGRGSTAEVFAAQLAGPAGFLRRVALKRVHPELATKPRFRQLLAAEARLAATLEHRNIVQVFELLEEGDELILVMEYCDGGSLRALLDAANDKGRTVPWQVIAQVGAEACAALAYLHGLKDLEGRPLELTHRDIAPENILLTRSGSVKLTDFGIARARAGERTPGGEVLGRLRYMPREQHLGLGAGDRVDVFALAAVLVELATGAPVFPDGHTRFLEQGSELPPLATLRPDFPPELCQRLLAALSREPGERPSAEVFSIALANVVGNTSSAMLVGALGKYVAQLLPEVGSAPLQAQRERPTDPTVEAVTPAAGTRDPWSEVTAPERVVPDVTSAPEVLSTREAQRRAAVQQLPRPGVLSLVGPRGVGKTTFARELVKGNPGPVAWVTLEQAPHTRAVGAIGAALGLDAGALEPLGDAARQALSRTLVVLDDAHPSLAPGVWRWCSAVPGARFVVTAPQPLGLGPAHETPVHLAALDEAESVALLQAASRAAGAPALADDVARRLAGALDGLPLALALASRAIAAQGLPSLLEALERGRGLGALRGAEADRAFESTLKDLEERDRSLLSRLAVFRGGFTLDAALAVSGLGAASEASLERLVHCNALLVRRSGTRRGNADRQSARRVRYAVPEWLRQRLVERGGPELESASEAHSAFFVRQGSGWLAGSPGHFGWTFRDLLEDELENVLAVHQRAQETLPMTSLSANHALASALVVAPLLSLRGPFERLLELLDTALSLADAVDVHRPLQVRALVARGEVLRKRGRLADSEQDLARARAACEGLSDARLFAECLLAGAALAVDRTHHEQAAAALDRVRVFVEAEGDERLEAQMHATWANLALEHGDFEAALESARHALDLFRRLGDERYEAICLSTVAAVYLEQGRYAAARGGHSASLAALLELGDRASAAQVQGYLGLDALFEGAVDEAAGALERAIDALGALGELRYRSLFEAWRAVARSFRHPGPEAAQELDRLHGRLTDLGDAVFAWTVQLLRAFLRGEREPERSAQHPEHDNDVRLARALFARRPTLGWR